MLARIIRHDLRLLTADRTLAFVWLLFVLLLAYALWNGATAARAHARQLAAAERTARTGIDLQKKQVIDAREGRLDPASVFGLGRPSGVALHAGMPVAPLAALSTGASELLPASTSIGVFSTKDELVKQSELDNPVNLLAGRFDPAFVFVYLYPLLILALSYNLLSAEKEQGTLALTMAQPVSLARLVGGKIIARSGVLLSLAALVTLVGLLMSGASSGDAGGDAGSAENTGVGGALARFMLLFAAVGVYTFFWFSLAVLVNSFGRSSATNAAVLAGLWLALVVIYPALLNVAATSLYPLPSRLQFIGDARDAENETNREAKNLLAKYMTDHPELAAGDPEANAKDFQMRYFVQKRELERRAIARTALHDAQLARQQRAVERFGFVSPAIVLQDIADDLAGTSRRRHELFARQARGFMDDVRAAYAPIIFSKASLGPEDYDRTPRFRFRDETTVDVARVVFFKLLLLTAPALVILGFVARRLRRYPLVG